jgi:hypothetical protein
MLFRLSPMALKQHDRSPHFFFNLSGDPAMTPTLTWQPEWPRAYYEQQGGSLSFRT